MLALHEPMHVGLALLLARELQRPPLQARRCDKRPIQAVHVIGTAAQFGKDLPKANPETVTPTYKHWHGGSLALPPS